LGCFFFNRKINGKTCSWRKKESGLGWFQDPITLAAPYVPENPTLDWFNEILLDEVKESIKNENSITTLLTGRSHAFCERIIKICKEYDVSFDHYGFKMNQEEATMKFKKFWIIDLIEKCAPKEIIMYEDRPQHMTTFNRFLGLLTGKYDLEKDFREKEITYKVEENEPNYYGKYKFDYTIKEIYLENKDFSKQQEREIIDYLINKYGNGKIHLKEEKVVTYTAVVLDKQSRKLLRDKYKVPNDWTYFAHHMTISLGKIDPKHFYSIKKEKKEKEEKEKKAKEEKEKEEKENEKAEKDKTKEETEEKQTEENEKDKEKKEEQEESEFKNEELWKFGRRVELEAIALGKSQNVLTLMLGTDVPSCNKIKHITIATHWKAKPAESNEIKDWLYFEDNEKFKLYGVIKEHCHLALQKRQKKVPVKSAATNVVKINYGQVFKKFHPSIQGIQIGKGVKIVQNFVSANPDATAEVIENFIK